jgi:penicillin-binding protein 1C
MKRKLAIALGVALLAAAGALAVDALSWDARAALDPAASGPLRVVDRHGELLRSVPSPRRPGREAWLSIERVSSTAVLTLLASEDQRFFEHGGVDPWSVLRAAWLDVSGFSARYGASTLTMQLARVLRAGDIDHSATSKLRQAATALRLEHEIDKRQILEQYLNRVYFGHGAYGLEAAARTYFDKPAASLSAGEATLLMVLPRSPAGYDLLAKRPRALARRDHLLGLLVAQGKLGAEAAQRARHEPLQIGLHGQPHEAVHFVDHVLAELPAAERTRGGKLVTTLDLALTRVLEHRTDEHVAELRDHGADQAGVLVLDTQSGAILAMVGSARGPDGKRLALNIATRRRFPGSALKPFVYAAAIAAGESSASLAHDVYDVPSRYRVNSGEPPQEFGPARYREALAGSYNLAAVHVLEDVGIEPVMNVLLRAGVGELPGTPDEYGLRLALGSTQVRLLDLAASYGAFTRGGTVIAPHGIVRLERADRSTFLPDDPRVTRALSPEVAWIVMDMLSDPEACRPRFGSDLPFDLPFRAAAKTGTARGFSDTLAIATTRELTVAAWTGRFDGRPMEGLSGMRGAAKLARAALLAASDGHHLSLPSRPAGVRTVEVCPLSGKLPGADCPHRKRELAIVGALPHDRCDFHRAGGEVVYPPELRGWARRNGLASDEHSAFSVASAAAH